MFVNILIYIDLKCRKIIKELVLHPDPNGFQHLCDFFSQQLFPFTHDPEIDVVESYEVREKIACDIVKLAACFGKRPVIEVRNIVMYLATIHTF